MTVPQGSAIEDGIEDGKEPTEAPSNRETPEPVEADENENPYISPMKAARLKRAKQKSKRLKELVQQPGSVADEEETVEADEVQDDEEGSAKTEEDRESLVVRDRVENGRANKPPRREQEKSNGVLHYHSRTVPGIQNKVGKKVGTLEDSWADQNPDFTPNGWLQLRPS